MSQLLALSFDAEASPSIRLKEAARRHDETDLPYGWGFGWYPGGEFAAVVIKDPTSSGDDPMTDVLRDWERFRSTVFVCHLRGAAKRITQRDAQPFIKSLAGRNWLFAHSGDLEGEYREAFPLSDGSAFEPLGRTDSEHLFCWLLEQMHLQRARCIADVTPAVLHDWFRKMNAFGTANFALSDGEDIAIYCDETRPESIHWIRRLPPHQLTHLESEALDLDLDNPRDPHRTMIVFSSKPLSAESWRPMRGGELLVARRAAVTWSSCGDVEHERRVAVEAPAVRLELVQAQSQSGEAPAGDTSADEQVLRVFHETVYSYEQPVERSTHRFRLRPVHDPYQTVLSHETTVTVDGLRREYEDVFGNHTTSYDISESFTELVVRGESVVRVLAQDPLRLRSPVERDSIPLVWMPWQRQMMLPYLLPPELPESELRELLDFAMSFVERNDYDLFETLLDVNQTIYRDFEYVSGSTTLATTPFQVYSARRGVCQDFANLMICMARLLNVPARYRMGYIFTGGRYENEIQSDASHAWTELYLPWIGWFGFDPTNGCQANLDHVRVAAGRNYIDASPTSGTIYKGGGTETLSLTVRVETVDAKDVPQPTTAELSR